jgi:hypothetical protein
VRSRCKGIIVPHHTPPPLCGWCSIVCAERCVHVPLWVGQWLDSPVPGGDPLLQGLVWHAHLPSAPSTACVATATYLVLFLMASAWASAAAGAAHVRQAC